ncbi:mediator of RNA polymerase II transcription subunit 22 [Entomortierella parvispora]|uniref:Mediator of RNA polymerase II transcription subunit 22 n=1 Tax=Entomortierella parvispora TaxID=205924 RepID=A0A9P3LVC6_9FUNG|nr:mediator of RNA polymerase II transcription subunit 22 [Entomortierella parvispora]
MASRPPGTPILGGQGVGVGGLSGGVGSTTPGGSAAASTAGPGVAASIVGGIGGTAGQTAAMAAAAVAARNANLSALQEIEEAYNKRLDMDVNQLMESFGDIIKVANITYTDSSFTKDKYKLAQESYQIQGRATNIVSSAESLLAMVTELKQTLLLNDTSTLAELSTRRQMELTIQKTAVKQRVVGLKEEVDRTIWELEQTCYGTAPVVQGGGEGSGANSLTLENDALQ